MKNEIYAKNVNCVLVRTLKVPLLLICKLARRGAIHEMIDMYSNKAQKQKVAEQVTQGYNYQD